MIFRKAERKNAFSREEWRAVPGFPGYEISSFAEIRGKDGRILKQKTTNQGYREIGLYRDGEQESLRVHRLVATAFLHKEPGKDLVNHIDCDKTNNRPGNLEWVSLKENAEHAQKNGRYAPTTGENHWTSREPWRRKIGVKNGRAVLTEEKAREIKSDLTTPATVLAKKYGISAVAIRFIRTGKTWRHL